MYTNGVYDLDLSHMTNALYTIVIANHTRGIHSPTDTYILTGDVQLNGIQPHQFSAGVQGAFKLALLAGLSGTISLSGSSLVTLTRFQTNATLAAGLIVSYTLDTERKVCASHGRRAYWNGATV